MKKLPHDEAGQMMKRLPDAKTHHGEEVSIAIPAFLGGGLARFVKDHDATGAVTGWKCIDPGIEEPTE